MKKVKPVVARNARELAKVLGLSPAEGMEIEFRSDLNDKIIFIEKDFSWRNPEPTDYETVLGASTETKRDNPIFSRIRSRQSSLRLATSQHAIAPFSRHRGGWLL